jgi:hypothetical protein
VKKASRVRVSRVIPRRRRRQTECAINPDKITKYLLNLDHPDGGPKARFFIGGGFSPDRPDELAAALKRHFLDNKPTKREPGKFGGEKVTMVRTVWIKDEGQTVYQLCTAYPID